MKTSLKRRWIYFIIMVLFSLALVFVYGITRGLDLQGGKRFVLSIDEQVLEETIKTELAKEGVTDASEFKARFAEEKEGASKQILTIIENRINQSGTKEPNVFEQKEGTERRIVVELPGVKEGDVKDLEDLLTRQAKLEFRGVDLNNRSLVRAILDENDPPPGYKVVKRKKSGSDRDFLMEWTDRDWKENPDVAATFGVDIDPETKLTVEDSLTTRAFKEKMAKSIQGFKSTAKSDLMLQKETIPSSGETVYQPYYIEVKPRMGGEGVKNAKIENQQGEVQVLLSFDDVGRKDFGNVTTGFGPNGVDTELEDGNNLTETVTRNGQEVQVPVGRGLAVVLDGTLYSAPRINEPILGGTAQITGDFSLDEATQLSLVLRSGAFRAPVEIQRNSTISPSLGDSAIRSGAFALILGSICILLFMLVYYRLAGVAVNLALLADLLLLPLGMFLAGGFLSIFSHQPGSGSGTGLPVLTLPGIAGLVLVIGMAVDANVLIFERIREEQAAGKRFVSAVSGGFDKAFSTILDANVTTLIVAIILYIYGSGPIRGFAVMLTAGIVVSVYTALVFTRMIFDHLAKDTSRERITMMSIMDNANFDFLSKRKIAAICSILLIGGTWAVFMMKGADNFGIDFRGGRTVQYSVVDGDLPETDDVRSMLAEKGYEEATILISRGDVDTLDLRIPSAEGETMDAKENPITGFLAAKYPDKTFKLEGNDTIGPQIGQELRKKGLISLLLALIGIVIYISFRFEFAFAMGAITALLHDVLITIGLFCLFGRQLSAPIIGALLTVVGYSVNDTIVVFDRIREDWLLDKQTPRDKLANISINRTLSRTILTSVTTLITVIMLLIFGGGAINDFALCLTIGVLVGTYSSVYVATPVMLFFKKHFSKKAAPAPTTRKKATA